MSGIYTSSQNAKSMRQAQNIANTYATALAAGASFDVQSREGVVDALTQPGGIKGHGVFADSIFSVPMSTDEKNLVKLSSALVESTLPDGSFYLQFRP